MPITLSWPKQIYSKFAFEIVLFNVDQKPQEILIFS